MSIVKVSTFILIVIFAVHLATSQTHHHRLRTSGQNCSKLEQFARSLSNFTYCSLVYTVPYNLCRMCLNQYQSLRTVYESLVNAESEPLDENSTCPQDIISKDKLTNIGNYYLHTALIWSAGNCDSEYWSADERVSLNNVDSSYRLLRDVERPGEAVHR